MKKIILILSVIINLTLCRAFAQLIYEPGFPNYGIQLIKSGTNQPYGDLYIYDGIHSAVFRIGKLSNAPTYVRAFYQWNINENKVPKIV